MIEQKSQLIDISEIMECIPHRYPFLLVDRVQDVVKNESATGIKNVTINEHFFQGHFPGQPVMPGVLIIEALAQTAGVLVCKSLNYKQGDKLMYFSAIEEVKFRKIVTPGDQLLMHVKIERSKLDFWKLTGEAIVNGEVVTKAKFSVKVVDKIHVTNS